MEITKEIARYLGYGKNTPDEQIMALINECLVEVQKVAEPKNIYRRFPVTVGEDDTISCAGITMQSHNLARNLLGCSEVVFMAATLGSMVDRLLNRYLKLQISKAAIVQATAAAIIEEYIDDWQAALADELAKDGLYLRPRFSPGYGDLSLEHQRDFLQILNAGKLIGITLSEGNIMLPEKSVTAIIGISSNNNNCIVSGCEACDNVECEYRRG